MQFRSKQLFSSRRDPLQRSVPTYRAGYLCLSEAVPRCINPVLQPGQRRCRRYFFRHALEPGIALCSTGWRLERSNRRLPMPGPRSNWKCRQFQETEYLICRDSYHQSRTSGSPSRVQDCDENVWQIENAACTERTCRHREVRVLSGGTDPTAPVA